MWSFSLVQVSQLEVTDEPEAFVLVPESRCDACRFGANRASMSGARPWLHASGWWTAPEPLLPVFGQPLHVRAWGRWQLGDVRKQLRKLGVERANITSHDPRLWMHLALAKDLRLPSGGTHRLLLEARGGWRWWLLGEVID